MDLGKGMTEVKVGYKSALGTSAESWAHVTKATQENSITWVMPGDRICNQIDYNAISKRWKFALATVKIILEQTVPTNSW